MHIKQGMKEKTRNNSNTLKEEKKQGDRRRKAKLFDIYRRREPGQWNEREILSERKMRRKNSKRFVQKRLNHLPQSIFFSLLIVCFCCCCFFYCVCLVSSIRIQWFLSCRGCFFLLSFLCDFVSRFLVPHSVRFSFFFA